MGGIRERSAHVHNQPATVKKWPRRSVLSRPARHASPHPSDPHSHPDLDPCPIASVGWKVSARFYTGKRSRRRLIMKVMKVSKRDTLGVYGSMVNATYTHVAIRRSTRKRRLIPTPDAVCAFLTLSPREWHPNSGVGIHIAQMDATSHRTASTCVRRQQIRRDVRSRLTGELPHQRRFVRNHRGSSESTDFCSHAVRAGMSGHRTVRAPWYAAHWSGF